MGRTYAGVLGSLAFLTVVVRGLLRAASVESTLLSAAISLFVFAFVGWIAGQLAGWIIEDAVRARVAAEIDALQRDAASPATAGMAASKT